MQSDSLKFWWEKLQLTDMRKNFFLFHKPNEYILLELYYAREK